MRDIKLKGGRGSSKGKSRKSAKGLTRRRCPTILLVVAVVVEKAAWKRLLLAGPSLLAAVVGGVMGPALGDGLARPAPQKPG